MSFPRYPAYKDSGVEWIPSLPTHWDLRRFKSIFTERIDKSERGDELLLSVSAYTGVTPRAELVDDGDHLSRAESLEGYKRCFKDDLVMNIMLAWNRGLAFTQFEGIVSPAYCVFNVIDGSHPGFLNYLVRSDEYTAYFKAFSSGVIDSRLRIYPETFGALSCALPPTKEQADIAALLDHETAKIDALVAEQEKLIELLKEKRQAVISHAVTKGLDPSVPMKNSGVEWLGEVPAHWEVKCVKHIGRLKGGAGFPHSEQGVEGEELCFYKVGALGQSSSTGYLTESENTVSRETASALGAFIFPKDTLVFAKVGAALFLGRVRSLPANACLDNNMMGLVVDETKHAPKFVRYAMSLVKFDLIANPGAVPSLNEGQIGNFALVCPPSKAEQVEIAAFLDNATGQLDELFMQAESVISTLQERRTALISAAVTGQIDVRSLTAEMAAA